MKDREGPREQPEKGRTRGGLLGWGLRSCDSRGQGSARGGRKHARRAGMRGTSRSAANMHGVRPWDTTDAGSSGWKLAARRSLSDSLPSRSITTC